MRTFGPVANTLQITLKKDLTNIYTSWIWYEPATFIIGNRILVKELSWLRYQVPMTTWFLRSSPHSRPSFILYHRHGQCARCYEGKELSAEFLECPECDIFFHKECIELSPEVDHSFFPSPTPSLACQAWKSTWSKWLHVLFPVRWTAYVTSLSLSHMRLQAGYVLCQEPTIARDWPS